MEQKVPGASSTPFNAFSTHPVDKIKSPTSRGYVLASYAPFPPSDFRANLEPGFSQSRLHIRVSELLLKEVCRVG
ncbi:hypothetical protein P8452_21229 [Trifolium repens]|nr:hypothetical protein P8452_21229 [Trifolium repens]